MRYIKWILTTAVFILALALGLLLFVQSEWAKDKIGTVLEEIALQQGFKLKIEKIEGELPLKWTLSHVHLELSDTDSIDIDLLRLRLSILPLLRKQIGISYLSADKTIYRFLPKEGKSTEPSFQPIPFSIRMLKVKEFEAINLKTHERAAYSLSGNCHFKKKAFDLYAKVHSPDLDLTAFIQGDKKIAADLDLHVKSEKAFAPFATIPYVKAFHLETRCVGSWNELLTGDLKLEFQKLDLPLAKGPLVITTHYTLFPDRSFEVSSLNLKSDLLSLQGNAAFDSRFYPEQIECSFHLAPVLKGIVKGNVHYTEKGCKIDVKSDEIASFKDIELTLHADSNWKGTFQMSASHPDLGFHSAADFHWLERRLELRNFLLRAPQTSVAGDLAFDIPSFTHLAGGLTFQVTDLSPFSQIAALPIAGQIGGTVDFQGEDIRCHAIAKKVQAGKFLSQHAVLDCFATDLFSEIKGKLDIETHDTHFNDITLASSTYSMGWNSVDWSYSVKGEGQWKNPFTFSSQGHFSFAPFQLHCDKLTGNLLQKNIDLQTPFSLCLKDQEMDLSDFRMTIEDGFVHSSVHISPKISTISLQAQHFPLDFLTLISPRLSLQGLSSIDIDLSGSNADLVGHFNLLLEHADIFPAGATTPIQTKASFQTNINHDIVQLHSHIIATGDQFVELSATVPLSYQLYPFKLSLDPHKNLAGTCTIEGHVEQLFDFINIGTQRFGGFLSCRLVCSGTPEKPALFGPLSVQGGFYQNYFIGIGFKNANIQSVANGNTLAIEHIDVTDDSQGTATATALFKLEPNLPFSIQGDVSHFRVIRFDWLTAHCSGPFTINGNLEKALTQGSLTVDEAEIHIPEQLPSQLPTLPVTFINQPATFIPPAPPSESYPFCYDLEIQGEDNIRLSGKGLDAELAGRMHLTGKNLNVTPVGTLKTKKGKFSFSGKEFKITDGEISFTDAGSFINITANLDMSELLVTVHFRGSLRSPDLIFESNPPLATSSILARILFNKDVSELNASQAGQLAYTIISLSGGAGPNILETIHKNLGIDRLGVSASEDTGKVSVQIGKYLMEGVLITLSQSTEQSQVVVEVEIKGGFLFQAETRFNNQGKFSFKWNKNY